MKTKRLLRVLGQDDLPEEDPQADADLSEYSTSSLMEFSTRIEAELVRRRGKAEGNISVNWRGTWNGDLNNKKAYLALIVKSSEGIRPYNYEFLKLTKSKEGSGWRGSFSGFLKEGDLLRGRVEMGFDCYYLVDRCSKNGLVVINESEGRKILRTRFKNKVKESVASI